MSATVVIVLITFAIVLGLIIWAIAKAQRQDRRAGEVESRRLFSWVKKIPKKTVFAVIAIALLLYGGYYFASCKGATQQITACPTHEEKFTLQPGEEKKV
ncbi:hypothetical protein COV23_01595, partial [Candidatus Wolfebacteria bacterium CG10_big_fil_rev_8_21_14_0_10_31_9]